MSWFRDRWASLRAKPWRLAALALIVLAHAGIAWWLIQVEQVLAPPEPTPPMEVGGGAPAQPSVVRTPPEPVEVEPAVPAPIEPAEEQAPLVGVAPIESPDPGFGLGGQGTGTGTGVGSGSGPGTGGSTGPRLVRGPSMGELQAAYPPRARSRGIEGRGMIRCVIRLDERLENCRVVDEQPRGQGFGEAALRASTGFRFRPPTEDGRPVEGREITVGVDFFLR